MNAMINELSAGVVFMGASFLIQSTLLILVALFVARRFAHRAALRNAIFRATLVAIVVSAPLCYALGRAGVSIATVELPRADATVTTPMPAEFSENARIFLPETTASAMALPEVADVPALAEENPSLLTAKNIYLGLALLWGAGIVCMMGYLGMCHWLVARTRRRGKVVDEPAVIERVREICVRINVRQPTLIVCSHAKSPMLIGLRNPAIIIPQSHEDALYAGQLSGVLIHELAHLARRDCAWNLFSRLTCAIAFFQPLVWVLARRIEDTSDEVADDYVLAHGGDGRLYARDLTDIAERFLPRRRESVAGVGVIRFQSSLGRRVQRILDSARDFATHVSWKGVMSICTITAIATVLVACLGMSNGIGTADAAEVADDTTPMITDTLQIRDDEARTDSPRAEGFGGRGAASSRSRRPSTRGSVTRRPEDGSGGRAITSAPPKEVLIERALDTKVPSFSFDETPLPDVIEFFGLQPHLKDINFVLSPALIPTGELPRELSVTLEMKDVSLRSALTATLKPRGYDFMIWSESIYIASANEIETLRNEARQAAGKPTPPAPESLEPIRTARERDIEALLAIQIPSFSFDETPLQDVIGYFRMQPEFKELNFVLDSEALLGREVFVTRTISNVSLETALNLMLHPHGLGYAIMNDSIFISTKEGIRRRMPLVLRTYNVSDLLHPTSRGSSPAMRGTFLANTLLSVTGNENWDGFNVDGTSSRYPPQSTMGAGGRGSMGGGRAAVFAEQIQTSSVGATWLGLDSNSGLLIVNQRADIHQQIVDILKKLRDAQKQAPDTPAAVESTLGGRGGTRGDVGGLMGGGIGAGRGSISTETP